MGDFLREEGFDADSHAQQMNAVLAKFWREQHSDIEQLTIDNEQAFKNHNDLPLARIKRIMKSDEDVRMISAEAPVLFAKACELFILELTLRAWCYSEQSKRKTLQREDVITAIQKTENFDFLIESVGRMHLPRTFPTGPPGGPQQPQQGPPGGPI
mmetsp:Transcript_12505/g.40934  ORF Transcript_12505/g.40934 Transcript_12505/m.40934 type:complete len:156 (-) Transcript_12505:481-948(-)